MRLLDIRKAKVAGKRVLVRVDFNVEVTTAGKLRDVTRLQATVPTITWLMRHGAQVLLVSHRGRPKGRENRLSLRPLVPTLRRLLKRPIAFIDRPLFSRQLDLALSRVNPRQVVLLENIRFEVGEEENSPAVAKRLAGLADLAVNDAFADSHRAHASIVGLARYIRMYAGLLVQREVAALTLVMKQPARPLVAIIGGAKISTKLRLIQRLLKQADMVLLGGALANTLLQAEGVAIGASLTEPTMLKAAEGLTSTNAKLKIPCDVVVALKRQAHAATRTAAVGNIRRREIILDIGPDTIELYGRIIASAKTVVWNGPLGVYELPPFNRATLALAKIIARHRCVSIAGGGETVDEIRRSGLAGRFTFLSTGGGAMLEFLEGKALPGVVAISAR